MGDSVARREAPQAARGPPQRRQSHGGAQNPQKDSDDDVCFVKAHRGGQGRVAGESARIAERRLSSPPQVVHQRHMPVGTQKFHIPRKTKEKLALFQPLSSESREYEDMLNILTTGYLDPASSGSFTYSKPRLVHSERLEKEFVERRRELKADGRTEKELEESYCFLLADSFRLQPLCEKGLLVGHSRMTVLGNPQKGVYLSRCSDLLQMNPFTPGAAGEILIFKVIKGKVKSIYENMKTLLDPTPKYDSHLSKSVSKVTSVMSYRAFELTQHYFYEYDFDELRQRPRQVCPYAVVAFQFKGKDTPLTSKPMAPLRSNSQSSDKSQERCQFTVWSGDLVKDDRVLLQISLCSSPPTLPHKLTEKLEIQNVMSWDQAIRRFPQSLFSYNLYNNSSLEVEKDGFYCSLLEVVDRTRSTTNVTKLLQELESKAMVLVTPLTERGFLFLLSSVQMALTHEREDNWKRSLHALFVFPGSRCPKSTPQSEPSSDSVSADSLMHGFTHFVPALHFALGKLRTNPPPDLSAGVEQQAREYINGIKEGVLRPYPVGKYEPELEQAGRQYPVPKLHRLGLESTLRPYLCASASHQLPMSRVRAMVHPLCVKLNQARLNKRQEPEQPHSHSEQKMQQLINLVLSCKRNAEKEVQSEMKGGTKRKRLEQETAQRAIKHLKASQELKHLSSPQQQDAAEVSSPGSLTSLIGSVGLKDADLQDEGSELAMKLLTLLKNLNQKATNQNPPEPQEAGLKESSPFGHLALKLGLSSNSDIDLRKQDDFEGGSVSSQEGGFSPSADPRPAPKERPRDPRRRPTTTAATVVPSEQPPQPDIPWVLIPITGLPPMRYSRKDPDVPQDPRLVHLLPLITPTTPPPASSTASATPIPTATVSPLPVETVPETITSPPAVSASSTPDPSPPASPSQCPSPSPSSPPSHCPSPEPEPEPESEEAFKDPPADGGEAFEVPQEKEEEIPDYGDAAAEPSPEEPPDAPSPLACSFSSQPSPKPTSPQNPTEPIEEREDEDLPDVLILDPTSPPLPLSEIDSIVDRHVDSFSSDLKRVLQNHSVSYSISQSPHSTSHPETTASTSSSGASISPLSQYIYFYHPCPPVQHYVGSLQREIGGVLIDYVNNGPVTTTTTTVPTSTDLASRVSEFVASIRAANEDRDAPEIWQTEEEGQVASSSMDYLDSAAQNDVTCSDTENEVDSFGDGMSGDGRRQVQFSSNHLEICIKNEPDSRDAEDAGDANAASPPSFSSDQNTLNSLIDQLEPEVFTNLVEIIKDLKRNAQHFYIHCAEEDDFIIQQIRVQLLKQSFIEKSPVVFLNQEEDSNGKLLVVIKNQDIADHIHQIPELLSLKRRPSVQFLGLDSAEDLRNHSGQELFASGGQVLSDEMILNPDCISHEKLSALLSMLEKHSFAENLWRWKVHCKTHKRLKEQSRFRRDAASLLDVLQSFQKKQIVDFLPYHKCDMSQGCELLDCAIELQGRYSNYRHTVVLTENCLGNSSRGGVIVCGIDEFLGDFRKVVGYHDNGVPQPIEEEPQLTEATPAEDAASGSISLHSEQDFQVLHRAIAQLRAERQQQLRDHLSEDNRDSQGAESTADVSTTTAPATSVSAAEQRPITPPLDKASVMEAVQLTPGRQAVAATLDLIHSSLQPTGEDQTEDPGRLQTQVQIDHRESPENKAAIDSTTTSSKSETPDRIPSTPGASVQSQVPDAAQRPDSQSIPETQVQSLDRTPTPPRVSAEAHAQSPETQTPVPASLGGSEGGSVPSASTKEEESDPGQSEPASVRVAAPNSSGSQDKSTAPSSTAAGSRSVLPVSMPTTWRPPLRPPGPPSILGLPHNYCYLAVPYMGRFFRPPPPQQPWSPLLLHGGGRVRVRPPPPRGGYRGGFNGM